MLLRSYRASSISAIRVFCKCWTCVSDFLSLFGVVSGERSSNDVLETFRFCGVEVIVLGFRGSIIVDELSLWVWFSVADVNGESNLRAVLAALSPLAISVIRSMVSWVGKTRLDAKQSKVRFSGLCFILVFISSDHIDLRSASVTFDEPAINPWPLQSKMTSKVCIRVSMVEMSLVVQYLVTYAGNLLYTSLSYLNLNLVKFSSPHELADPSLITFRNSPIFEWRDSFHAFSTFLKLNEIRKEERIGRPSGKKETRLCFAGYSEWYWLSSSLLWANFVV